MNKGKAKLTDDVARQHASKAKENQPGRAKTELAPVKQDGKEKYDDKGKAPASGTGIQELPTLWSQMAITKPGPETPR